MNYIKIFQNSQALSFSVVKNYSEYQLMHILLDDFHQGGKYSAQIASHLEQLRREGNFTDKKYLSISYLQTNYLNLDSSSGSGKKIEISNIVDTKCTFFRGANNSAENKFKSIRKDKEKARTAGCLGK